MDEWMILCRNTEALRYVHAELTTAIRTGDCPSEGSLSYVAILVEHLLKVAPPLPSDRMFNPIEEEKE